MNRLCSQLGLFGLAGHACGPVAECSTAGHAEDGVCFVEYALLIVDQRGGAFLFAGQVMPSARQMLGGRSCLGWQFLCRVLLIVVLRRNPPCCQDNVGHEEGANVSGFLYSASSIASA